MFAKFAKMRGHRGHVAKIDRSGVAEERHAVGVNRTGQFTPPIAAGAGRASRARPLCHAHGQAWRRYRWNSARKVATSGGP
jgi:hypothetical protein